MKKLAISILSIFALLLSSTLNADAAFEGKKHKLPVQLDAKYRVSKGTFSESEPNDTKETANKIDSISDVNGMLSDETDQDFYRFEMPYNGSFYAGAFLGESFEDMDYFVEDYDIKVYKQDGTLIAKSETESFEDEESGEYYFLQELEIELTKGTYYLSLQSSTEYSEIYEQPYMLVTGAEFETDFSISSVTTDVKSPQIVGKSIKVTANGSEKDLEYRFTVDGDVVRDFNKSNTFTWKPTKAATYKIIVEARKPNVPDAVVQKEIQYVIQNFKADFSISSFTSSLKSPQVSGKTIKFTTKTDKSGLQYQYSINGSIGQKFGTKNTYDWKPGKTGKYTVKVEVRRPEYPGTVVSKSMTYEIKDGNVKVSALTANLTSPRPTNTTVKWTASATGVDLEYKFSVYQNKKWSTLQNYSTKNYTNWKPGASGKYTVRVDVRSKASGKTAYKQESYEVFKPSSFSITSFTASKKSPQAAGTFVTFKAKTKGSYLEYRFRIHDGYSWTTVRDFGKGTSFDWTPYYTGKYKIAVDVRVRGTSKIQTKYINYDVREAPNWTMNLDYDIYFNNGYLRVVNNGYKNLSVSKIEFLNDGKVIYSYSPKNYVTIGRQSNTFYFTPNSPITKFNYDTVIKVTFTYDGITHTGLLTRY